MISVFFSHSHQDAELVKRLIVLVRSALNLPSRAIRATSVDGYRLPVGSKTDEQLRMEVQEAEVLVGVISSSSILSAYVTFELGARWGSGKPMFTLLAPDFESYSLPGPLQGISALSCRYPGQLHQFVEELASHLDIQLDRPAAYQKCIEDVLALTNTGRSSAGRRAEADQHPVNKRPVESLGEEVSGSGKHSPHFGQPKLSEAEHYAYRKLTDGVAPAEIVSDLERRGVPRRMAEEMTDELRQEISK